VGDNFDRVRKVKLFGEKTDSYYYSYIWLGSYVMEVIM
jgi:hypothetical protein